MYYDNNELLAKQKYICAYFTTCWSHHQNQVFVSIKNFFVIVFMLRCLAEGGGEKRDGAVAAAAVLSIFYVLIINVMGIVFNYKPLPLFH